MIDRGVAAAYLVACSLAVGCNGGPGAESLAPLCDGSEEIRLEASLAPGRLTSIEYAFAAADGSLRLRISGQCEYWVNDNSWLSQHGMLSEEAAERVSDALHYTELPSLEGSWKNSSCFDPPTLELRAAGHVVECVCNCDNSGTPNAVRDINSRFEQLMKELASQGDRWDGLARVLIVKDDTLEDQGPRAWDLSTPIAELETPFSELTDLNDVPEGFLIDGEDASRIRELMDEYGSDFPERSVIGTALPIIDSGQTYGVYTRDIYEESE